LADAVPSLFMGEIDPKTLQEKAAKPDSKVEHNQKSKTNFSLEEWHMLKQQQEHARALFQEVERECFDSNGYSGAVAKLKRM
jgi:hypothetical protein